MNTLKANQLHLIEDMDIAMLILVAVKRIEAAAVNVKSAVVSMSRRRAERRYLSMMDDHMLQDIGLSHHQVKNEVNKFFWQK